MVVTVMLEVVFLEVLGWLLLILARRIPIQLPMGEMVAAVVVLVKQANGPPAALGASME